LRDGFVLKLNPDASALVYSTYLGGFGFDGATAVAVDSAGNAYVVGNTTSADFAVATNAFQSTIAGRQDGFIVKINSDDVKTSESYSFAAGGGVRTATQAKPRVRSLDMLLLMWLPDPYPPVFRSSICEAQER
jgi:hypothetical protein